MFRQQLWLLPLDAIYRLLSGWGPSSLYAGAQSGGPSVALVTVVAGGGPSVALVTVVAGGGPSVALVTVVAGGGLWEDGGVREDGDFYATVASPVLLVNFS